MRRLLVTLCFVVLGSSVAYSSGFSIYEASVRANGMMGAFSAYADHVTTIYYNPAGLAGLEGLNVSGGATIIAPRTTLRGPLPYSNTEYEMKKQNFLVPNLFGSYQIKEGLTAGIGVYAPFGLGTHWNDDWYGRGGSVQADIQMLFANPAVGYTLPEFGIGKIKVGAGLQVAFHGEVTLSRAIQEFTPEASFRLDGELKKPAYGYNLGILYEPVDMLTLGFTYRSEVKVEFEGEGEFRDLPGNPRVPVRGNAAIDLPASWVAAVNIEPMPGLKAEVDYVWWGWSSYDELAINFDQTVPGLGIDESVSERNYENSWQLRGGVELSKLPVEGLTLRAGIAYDKNPIKDRYVDPTLPDSDRLLFSGGVTYSVTPTLDLDASYIFIRAEERTVTDTEVGINGVYNTYANLPSLGITLNL